MHIMGLVNKPTQVPLTLLILGENNKVLASKTEYAEFTGASASYEFNVKSVMSGIEEKDVYFISAEIKMYDQEIHIIVDKNKLILPTYCLELFIAQSYPEDVEIFPSDKKTCGKWGELTQTPTQPQNAEGVQDQFNFAKLELKPYLADPKIFRMEESIDIGSQVLQSLKYVGKSNNGKEYFGGVREAYEKALDRRGELQGFEWINTNPDNDNFGKIKAIPFNSSALEAIKTKAWSFGRVSAKLVDGKIMACKNGWYYVEGKLVFDEDYYSWIPDATNKDDATLSEKIDTKIHNKGIEILGQNKNSPGQGNWKHRTGESRKRLGDTEPSIGTAWRGNREKDEVEWNKASKAYDHINPKKNGQMPIQYVREFYFYTYGKL